MFFKQIKVEGLGCLSYIIGCPLDGRAVVVDPKRDVDEYLQIAEENNLTISSIIETHVHADHISGGQELKARTDADIYIHENAGVAYAHKKLKDGDKIEIGKVLLEIVYTPGHTPNAITLAVTDRSRGESPEMLLTGDLLFVGSIGRPDLAGNELLDEQIRNLYQSLHEKLGRFQDLVEIYPAHGEGSLCGSGLSAKPSSTLGFERKNNVYFQLSFDEFKKKLTERIPFRPKNFSHIISQNKKGPLLFSQLVRPVKLSTSDIEAAVSEGKNIIDLRDATSFGGAHVPGSLNIGFTPQSATWLGTVVDPDKALVLLANQNRDIESAISLFRKAGYDNITGFSLGLSAWISQGEETGFLPQVSIHGLNRILEKYANHNVIDVRTPEEWKTGHIKNALSIPLNNLIEKGTDLGKEDHVSIVCGSGYRSNIAGSMLKSRGFDHVYSVIGGMNAWRKKYGVET